uniref:Uncharacterized protein n=1 Tax=Setaria viridis TaxID=4556 RepID=A0A4U6UD33_SETVI|nr:hypothetical protein SEVIR_5G130700v2 [Setaria viridis]
MEGAATPYEGGSDTDAATTPALSQSQAAAAAARCESRLAYAGCAARSNPLITRPAGRLPGSFPDCTGRTTGGLLAPSPSGARGCDDGIRGLVAARHIRHSGGLAIQSQDTRTIPCTPAVCRIPYKISPSRSRK